MTSNNGELRKALVEVGLFGRWALSSLLDGAFMAIWIIIQWGANQVLDRFPISGIDLWMLRTFQVVFAVTTLAPILLYIYVDIVVMALRARRRIEDEREKPS